MAKQHDSHGFLEVKVSIAIQKAAALATVVALIAGCLTAGPARAAQGTWTAAPAEPVNGGPAFGLWLLTDGTVLSHSNALNNWCKLVPGADGNYADGTWVQLASSPFAEGGATEHILKDGKFLETGAEYLYAEPSGFSSTDYNDVQIYDPVANTWQEGPAGLYTDIGDSGSAMLANGEVFGSSRTTQATEIFNESTNSWTAAATQPWNTGDEDAFTALSSGAIFSLSNSGAGLYNPATNTWSAELAWPSPFYPGDIGPTELLYDGRILCLGYETTAIFTPTSTSTGTWVNGPAYPGGSTEDAEDEYGCTEPDGLVMFAAYPVGNSPNELVEFNPTTNTFATITPPPDSVGPYPVSYCDLPNGQVMVCCGSTDWLYTPASAPNNAWRPAVTSVASNGGSTYTLTGTQLSGLVAGWDEGDDMSGAENYPIVWLTNSSGNVWYCKSFNFSTMIPSTSGEVETCQFTTPSGLANGTYSLYVSSVGVKSLNAYSFTVGSTPSFSLSASPSSLSIAQGSNGASTISVSDINGFSGSVAFTATGLPSGVTAVFSPTSSTSSSTLTLTASSTATTGASTVTITGTSGSIVQTTTVALTVTASSSLPNPTAWWKFDQSSGTSAPDSSGNGYTGTVTGGTWTTSSKVGTDAISFAGAGDMSAASGIIDTSKSFTVACWGKLNNTSSYEDFMTVDGTTTSAFYLQYNAGNGKISFNRLASDSDTAAATIAAASSTPSTGTWYYIVGVYNSSTQTIALYINGTLQQSVSYTTGWKGTGSTLVGRGKFSGNSTDYLNGVVDDARIYNSALTSAQVSALYSSGG